MKRHPLYDMSRSEIEKLAEQYIHHKIYRNIFIDRYCDGYTIDELTTKYMYESRHIYNILRESMSDLIKHI